MSAALRNAVPWWGKVGLKLLFSALPVDHRTWRRLGVFRHGNMDDPATAIGIFRLHFDRWTARRGGRPGFVMLELGPGDGLLSGVIARAFGAEASYLVDVCDDAAHAIEPFRRMAAALQASGHAAPTPPDDASFEAALAFYGMRYLTGGLASLRTVPDASVDLCWSQAVLEHVRRAEMPAVLAELRRVLKPDGIGSHVIDLQDHLGGGLNNLRFTERFWEAEWIARAGFYTNRLQARDYARLFQAAGFAPEIVGTDRWPTMPLPRRALARPFADLRDDELLVRQLDVLLFPVAMPAGHP